MPVFPFCEPERRLNPLDAFSAFLAQSERRAFKQAYFAVRDEEAALDIVQNAMLKLAEHYADRPAEEWPMLFQRILQNAIHDHYRRSKTRSTWVTLFSAFAGNKDDDDEHDLLDTLQPAGEPALETRPEKLLAREEIMHWIEAGLAQLPARQREAFLLRYWEEMDVAETAQIMGCSEGSVKTHCSRANHALAAFLKDKGIDINE